jgi:hypothetical protein
MGQGLPAAIDLKENQQYFKSPRATAETMFNGLFALQY